MKAWKKASKRISGMMGCQTCNFMEDSAMLFIKGQLRVVGAALSDCRKRYQAAKRMGMTDVMRNIGMEIVNLKAMAAVLAVPVVLDIK